MNIVDVELFQPEKEAISEALRDARRWKEQLWPSDRLASKLFAAVELRLMEILQREKGTLVEE